jgi:hypothetical protein
MRRTKESSGERLSLSKRLSQGKEKVSGSFGYLALGGPGHRGCPRLTLHEELHSLGHLSRSAEGGARISRMPVSVQDGRAMTVVLNPSWYPNQTPFTIWNGLYPQAVIPRVWNRALVTVMSNAGW